MSFTSTTSKHQIINNNDSSKSNPLHTPLLLPFTSMCSPRTESLKPKKLHRTRDSLLKASPMSRHSYLEKILVSIFFWFVVLPYPVSYDKLLLYFLRSLCMVSAPDLRTRALPQPCRCKSSDVTGSILADPMPKNIG